MIVIDKNAFCCFPRSYQILFRIISHTMNLFQKTLLLVIVLVLLAQIEAKQQAVSRRFKHVKSTTGKFGITDKPNTSVLEVKPESCKVKAAGKAAVGKVKETVAAAAKQATCPCEKGAGKTCAKSTICKAKSAAQHVAANAGQLAVKAKEAAKQTAVKAGVGVAKAVTAVKETATKVKQAVKKGVKKAKEEL